MRIIDGYAIFTFLVIGLFIGVIAGFFLACILKESKEDEYQETIDVLVETVQQQDKDLNFYRNKEQTEGLTNNTKTKSKK
jgi:uncharacterized membrane-anchored protein YhcB (DUF1043 family)